MNSVVFLFVGILVASSLAMDDDFEVFKVKYGKKYLNETHEEYHRSVFFTAKWHIDKHNADPSNTFSMRINQFTDIDPLEFTKTHTGQISSIQSLHLLRSKNRTIYKPAAVAYQSLPSSIDWRDKGVVTDVKDQGACGACWAFSTTGVLEGQHALKTGNLVSLSEQQLVDCSTENFGCSGGVMHWAYQYILDNGGISSEDDYPYTAVGGTCAAASNTVSATLKDWVDITEYSCQDLKTAVANVGPISVSMDVEMSSLQYYNGGTYWPQDPSCTSSLKGYKHAVLVVGYGMDDSGVDYWLVKNNWGTGWGIDGYLKIASKDNLCGICNAGSYPVV